MGLSNAERQRHHREKRREQLDLDPIYALLHRMRVELVDSIIQERDTLSPDELQALISVRDGNLPVDGALGFVKGAVVNELHYMLKNTMDQAREQEKTDKPV